MKAVTCFFLLLALTVAYCQEEDPTDEGEVEPVDEGGAVDEAETVAEPMDEEATAEGETGDEEATDEGEPEDEEATEEGEPEDEEAMEEGEATDEGECLSVAETAIEAELSTLVAALTAADLVDTVGPEFNGTVFAPTEDAFAALLTDLGLTAEELLEETELLTQVLLIHVIPGVAASSSDLEDGQEIPTAAEGVSVIISIDDEGVFVIAPSGVRAQVVTADVSACDAIVHIIDAVLTPAIEVIAEAPGPGLDEIDLIEQNSLNWGEFW